MSAKVLLASVGLLWRCRELRLVGFLVLVLGVGGCGPDFDVSDCSSECPDRAEQKAADRKAEALASYVARPVVLTVSKIDQGTEVLFIGPHDESARTTASSSGVARAALWAIGYGTFTITFEARISPGSSEEKVLHEQYWMGRRYKPSSTSSSSPSKHSGEAMVVKDYMGRVIRIHKNGFVTTYEYPTSGDRRIPISSKTVRE